MESFTQTITEEEDTEEDITEDGGEEYAYPKYSQPNPYPFNMLD